MGLSTTVNYDNNSYSFFGPMGMAFQEDGETFDETPTFKIIISFFWALSMVVSVIGNSFTCAVICRERAMRTPTNCYLFNLAITDIMIALYVPMEIYILWVPDYYPFGEEGCRFQFVLWDFLSNCSVMTISAFTLERYLVVTKPFLRQKFSSKKRVFRIIGLIWVISCIFCVPDAFYIDLLEKKKYSYCYITVPDELAVMLIFEVILFFLVPMTVIIVIYVLIALKLKSTRPKLRSSSAVANQSRDKAVRMLAAVAGMFFFCWSPFCIYRFMMSSSTYRNNEYFPTWRVLNYLCSINVYLSAAVNPILYRFMSQKFRRAFKNLMTRRPTTNIAYATNSNFGYTISSSVPSKSLDYKGVKLKNCNTLTS